MCMSTTTRRELMDLIDELIAATDDNTYWLGPVRDISLEIRELLTRYPNDQASMTVKPITANWKCPIKDCRFGSINPMEHPYPLL